MSIKSLALTVATLAIVAYCLVTAVYQAADKMGMYFDNKYSVEVTNHGK